MSRSVPLRENTISIGKYVKAFLFLQTHVLDT